MIKVIEWDGRRIDKAGFYSGVPMADYHGGKLCAGPSLSSGGHRKIFNESEAHYWDTSPYNLDRDEPKESEAMIMGRAAHHLLLGEKFFSREYVIRPEVAPDGRQWNGNNDTCKRWIAAHQKAGKTILKPDMAERVVGIAKSLATQPLVIAGALNGLIETTMVWQDEQTGIWCLSRPDVIPTASGDKVDLKLTASVLWRDLVRTIGEFAYHQQGALVAEGYRILTGEPLSSFNLMFVESQRPHCSYMVALGPNDLARGEKQNLIARRRFAKAMKTGEWPGPGGRQENVPTISLSDAMRESIDKRIAEGLADQ